MSLCDPDMDSDLSLSTRVNVDGKGGVRVDFVAVRSHAGTDIDTATHCSTLQHTATHFNTLQHTAMRWYAVTQPQTLTLQHTAARCNTLEHAATHCNTLQHTKHAAIRRYVVTQTQTLQNTGKQHTATHGFC